MKSLILLLLATPALAQELYTPEPPPPPPHYQVQQGGTVVIPLNPEHCYGLTLEALGRNWRCERDGRLLLGASYDESLGLHDVTAPPSEEARVLATVCVAPATFDRDEKRKRSRPAGATRRRAVEQAKITAALTAGERNHPCMTLHPPWQPPLDVMEVSGDTYGMYRDNVVYRGKGKKRKVVDSWTTRHAGVDLRAPTGTHIYSPGQGVVVHAARTSAEGNMVILYHGSSVYTLHLHLSRIKVREGQHVDPGQPIGSAGDTGASRGPHLHYATKVGGVSVDPEAFIDSINRDWQ